MLALTLPCARAQSSSKANLDVSETLFGVFTALNTCGYDQDLNSSAPLRAEIRDEAMKAAKANGEAADAREQFCSYYRDHLNGDAARDLAQYVSLALYLGPPPAFTPKVKESELPPDATYVIGAAPYLSRLYEKANWHALWTKHEPQFNELIQSYHAPLAKLLFDTDIYLKLSSSGYLGRGFTIYLEPMGAPGQANARNYGADYFLVITPNATSLKLEQIRHTYLHYVLDPMAMKRSTTLKRLEPLLESVRTAPMDDSFKTDISLLVTESLIRAIEARTPRGGKFSLTDQKDSVQASMQEGYILTQYFYDALERFEKDPAGLRDAYSEMLFNVDPVRESRRASTIEFATQATPEILAGSRPRLTANLRLAEQKLSIGDIAGAQKLAQQVLDKNDKEDTGYALFVLARAATMSSEMDNARAYFERTLQASHEPRLVAWSQIYLGRIFDLQGERETAVEHYRAALSAGASNPEIKSAAERGLKQAYEPPAAAQHPQ